MVWLRRIGHCRGFGIQSPWAYRIVRNVVNEHYPYYAYEPLGRAYPGGGAERRKLRELCLRMANYMQPRTVVAYGDCDGALEAYVKAGCMSAEYHTVPFGGGDGGLHADLALVAQGRGCGRAFATVAAAARDGSAAVLFGIRRDRPARRLWRRIVDGEPGVVTFDLYYCGLVFFDSKRYKQNYIINF